MLNNTCRTSTDINMTVFPFLRWMPKPYQFCCSWKAFSFLRSNWLLKQLLCVVWWRRLYMLWWCFLPSVYCEREPGATLSDENGLLGCILYIQLNKVPPCTHVHLCIRSFALKNINLFKKNLDWWFESLANTKYFNQNSPRQRLQHVL